MKYQCHTNVPLTMVLLIINQYQWQYLWKQINVMLWMCFIFFTNNNGSINLLFTNWYYHCTVIFVKKQQNIFWFCSAVEERKIFFPPLQRIYNQDWYISISWTYKNVLHTVWCANSELRHKGLLTLTFVLFVDMPVIGYIHQLSPVKQSQNNNAYFDMKMQTEDRTVRTVCTWEV